MAENLTITALDKESRYQELLPQIKALVSWETDTIANLANITAALHMAFSWLWVGFYLVRDEELVLGPFQGPIACTRIKFGSGVCGATWQRGETIVVTDVDQFPGHIACSSLAKSEIVVPLKTSQAKIIGVLDVDSASYAEFDDIDKKYLEELINTPELIKVFDNYHA